jgi:hypothetical protein
MDAESQGLFVVLARQAFDVMLRRGWGVDHGENGWEPCVDLELTTSRRILAGVMTTPGPWPDPFTALVEFDRWYRENIEASPAS